MFKVKNVCLLFCVLLLYSVDTMSGSKPIKSATVYNDSDSENENMHEELIAEQNYKRNKVTKQLCKLLVENKSDTVEKIDQVLNFSEVEIIWDYWYVIEIKKNIFCAFYTWMTPLEIAIFSKSKSKFASLIHHGADLNQRLRSIDHNGFNQNLTPLASAVKWRNIEVVKYLVSKGAPIAKIESYKIDSVLFNNNSEEYKNIINFLKNFEFERHPDFIENQELKKIVLERKRNLTN